MGNAVFYAACGTGFTFLMTVLGAAVVFIFRKDIDPRIERAFMGFAAGVMMAASVWSLLIPAIEDANETAQPGWLPVACGFAAGGLFLFAMDRFIVWRFTRVGENQRFFGISKGTTLLLSAVALHNIPQGMATGLAFLMALRGGAGRQVFAAAVVLALGIGIQNLPEGSAVALPIRRDGVSSKRAFFISAGAGILEPVSGIGIAVFGGSAGAAMPWLLSFAAGSMIYVIAEELIPEASRGNDRSGTFGVMIGFLIMMVLDVALA